MRALLLVLVCGLLAFASASVNKPPGNNPPQGLQSCKPAALNAIPNKTQRLTAIRVCVNAKSVKETPTLYHYGPKAQWDTWQTPGLDIALNALGFNAYRYPIAYRAHAKHAAKMAPLERPAVVLGPLAPSENACWDYPLDKAGGYNRYNCLVQHRAKYFEGLAVKYKKNKSFAKGYAVAKSLGTAKLTVNDDPLADSMGAGIYYCPSRQFLDATAHGETLSECTFTQGKPLLVFNIDEQTPEGRENLQWLEDIRMFGEAEKNKQLIKIEFANKKIKNRFTNQADVESIFNFHPTGNLAVRYRSASNLNANQPPYYVLKRMDLSLCKLSAKDNASGQQNQNVNPQQGQRNFL